MNNIQKLAHNFVEAFKPLNDAIDQMCRIAQKPLLQIPPDLFKDINIKGLESRTALSDPIQSDMGALRKSIDPSFRISWHLPDDCEECRRKRIFSDER